LREFEKRYQDLRQPAFGKAQRLFAIAAAHHRCFTSIRSMTETAGWRDSCLMP
jgi:hypothetical protein